MGSTPGKLKVSSFIKCQLCSSYYKEIKPIFRDDTNFPNEQILSEFQKKHPFICIDCEIQLIQDVLFYVSAISSSKSQVKINLLSPDSKLGIMMRSCSFPYALCCAVMMKDLEMIETLVRIETEARLSYWKREAIPNDAKFSILHYACTSFQIYKEDIEKAFKFLPIESGKILLEEIMKSLKERDNPITRNKILKLLLPITPDVYVTDTYGMTCLTYLSKYSDFHNMKLLISEGVEVTISELFFPTQFVFEEKENISPPDLAATFLECISFNDFVHAACRLGNFEVLTFLLTHVCPHYLNYVDAFGFTPLHYAILHNHLHIVNYLLRLKCLLNVQNKGGETPLHIAFKNEQTTIIKHIFKGVMDTTDENEETHGRKFSYLLKVKDWQGNTPLHCIKRFSEFLEIFEFLIDHEVDLIIENRLGLSPLDIEDSMGNTLLTAAMKAKMFTLCKKLFLEGVHPARKQKLQKVSPIQIAIRNTNVQLVKLCVFHIKAKQMEQFTYQGKPGPTSSNLSKSCTSIVSCPSHDTSDQKKPNLFLSNLSKSSISLANEISQEVSAESNEVKPSDNQSEPDVTTELEYLIAKKHNNIFEVLVFSGLFESLTKNVTKNWCPLNFAVQHENLQILLLLLDADVSNFSNQENKMTALKRTAEKSKCRNAAVLLRNYRRQTSALKKHIVARQQNQFSCKYKSVESSEFRQKQDDDKHATRFNPSDTDSRNKLKVIITHRNEESIPRILDRSSQNWEDLDRYIESNGTVRLWCADHEWENPRDEDVRPINRWLGKDRNKKLLGETFKFEEARNQIVDRYIDYLKEEQEFFNEFNNDLLVKSQKDKGKLQQRLSTLNKELLFVKRENEFLKRKHAAALVCRVCMDANINAVLTPCNHLVVCKNCARMLHSCPVCRTAKQSFTVVYL